MKRSNYFWTMVCALASGIMSITWAEEIRFASTKRMDAVETRMMELEAELAGYRSSGERSVSCTDSCCSEVSCCPPCSCFSFMAETLFLRAFQTDGGIANRNYFTAPRLTGAWTSSSGLGLRARWYEFDAAVQSDAGAGILDQVVLAYVDIEITDTFRLGRKIDGVLSCGVRFAEYVELEPGNNVDFDGTGLLVGIELNRHMTSNFSLLCSVRESLAYGEDHADVAPGGDFVHQLIAITEIQLGTEWRQRFAACEVFGRIGAEAQYWGGLSDDDTENLGVIGGVLSVGINR